MRRGEPRKLAPLTRSRGMIAASLLVVAVTATYASLAMLSLSVSAPGLLLRTAGSVASEVGHVGWHNPDVAGLGVKVLNHTVSHDLGSGVVSYTPIAFGTTLGPGYAAVSLKNNSAKFLPLRVGVVGDQTLGVSATFVKTGERDHGCSAAHGRAGLACHESVVRRRDLGTAGDLGSELSGDSHLRRDHRLSGARGARRRHRHSGRQWGGRPVVGPVALDGRRRVHRREQHRLAPPSRRSADSRRAPPRSSRPGRTTRRSPTRCVAVADGVSPQLTGAAAWRGRSTTDSQAPTPAARRLSASPGIDTSISSNVSLGSVTVGLPPSSLPSDTITVDRSRQRWRNTVTGQTYAGGSGA